MPNQDFFVYRVHKDDGVDVMSEYLGKTDVVVCEISKKNHESSKFNSFKVAVMLMLSSGRMVFTSGDDVKTDRDMTIMVSSIERRRMWMQSL